MGVSLRVCWGSALSPFPSSLVPSGLCLALGKGFQCGQFRESKVPRMGFPWDGRGSPDEAPSVETELLYLSPCPTPGSCVSLGRSLTVSVSPLPSPNGGDTSPCIPACLAHGTVGASAVMYGSVWSAVRVEGSGSLFTSL